jgi:hypothetical protein
MATNNDINFDNDEDFQLGESFASNNIEESSKKLYAFKIRHFEEWIRRKQSHIIENDEIQYNLISNEIISAFFGHISKKRDLKEERRQNNQEYVYIQPTVHQSFDLVSGYKSAIVDQMSRRGIILSESTKMHIKSVFAGYKRKVINY